MLADRQNKQTKSGHFDFTTDQHGLLDNERSRD